MKDRKKNKTERIKDAEKVVDAIEACVKACDEFRQAFYDYELDVSHMPISMFLQIKDAAQDHKYASRREAQTKVGDCHKDDVTHHHFYEDEK